MGDFGIYLPRGMKPIPGYEGCYAATPEGSIVSLPRVVNRRNGTTYTARGGVVRPRPHSKGYLSVTLSKGGAQRDFTVHALVASAFIGAVPVGMEVAHGDGDKRNNHFRNLRYDTPVGNTADNVAHGKVLCGEAVRGAKLTAEKIRRIRAAIGSQASIAKEYGVSQTLVGQIKRRVIWKHVP